MTDKVQKIREVIEKRYEYWRKKEFNSHSTESEIRMSECKRLLFMVDSLQEEPVSKEIGNYDHKVVMESLYPQLKEEPVSEELEEAIDTYLKSYWGGEKEKQEWPFLKKMAIYFAKWQKEQMTAKAIDGRVIANGMGNPILHLWNKGRHLIDKKVKVVVIKED